MNNSNSRGPNNGPRQQNRRPQPQRNQDNRGGNDNRNRSYRSGNRYRRPSNRTLNSTQVLIKYDNLLELHLRDRRRYFEYYNRVDDHQRYKLEKQFFASIEHLRKFEASLEDWQREYLKKKTEKYRLDLTYSSNHQLPPIAEKVDENGEYPDPHFTAAQRKAFEDYKTDIEESSGNYDDYLKYKNLN